MKQKKEDGSTVEVKTFVRDDPAEKHYDSQEVYSSKTKMLRS